MGPPAAPAGGARGLTHPLLRFAVAAILWYGLLAASWPWVAAAYGALYRGLATAAFAQLPGGGRVRFAPAGPGAPMDTELVLQSRRDPAFRGTTPHDSRITGYLPTVELAALVLATPVSWRRRRRALLVGLAALHAFIAVRLGTILLHWYTGDASWSIYRVGPWWDRAFERLFETLAVAPVPGYAVPVFIWVAVTFRAEDRALLAPGPRTPQRV